VFRRFNTYREAKVCFDKAIGRNVDEEKPVILESIEIPNHATA
jgi:hypothetical protein